MPSHGFSSSLALIAFTSLLTLLISHLAIRQTAQIIQSPLPTPPPSLTHYLPSPPSPPPALPTQTVSPPPAQPLSSILVTNNSVGILHTLIALVLLIGLSCLWLEQQRPTIKEKHAPAPTKSRRLLQKKKGYISSSEESDDEQGSGRESFPGGWKSSHRTKTDTGKNLRGRKADIGSRREAIEVSEPLPVGSCADSAGGQRRSSGPRHTAVGENRKTHCCTCCRSLLEEHREKRELHRKDESVIRKHDEGTCTNNTLEGAWKERATSNVSQTTASTAYVVDEVVESTSTLITLPSQQAIPKPSSQSALHPSHAPERSQAASTTPEGGCESHDRETASRKGRENKGNAKAIDVGKEEKEEADAFAEPPMAMPDNSGAFVDQLAGTSLDMPKASHPYAEAVDSKQDRTISLEKNRIAPEIKKGKEKADESRKGEGQALNEEVINSNNSDEQKDKKKIGATLEAQSKETVNEAQDVTKKGPVSEGVSLITNTSQPKNDGVLEAVLLQTRTSPEEEGSADKSKERKDEKSDTDAKGETIKSLKDKKKEKGSVVSTSKVEFDDKKLNDSGSEGDEHAFITTAPPPSQLFAEKSNIVGADSDTNIKDKKKSKADFSREKAPPKQAEGKLGDSCKTVNTDEMGNFPVEKCLEDTLSKESKDDDPSPPTAGISGKGQKKANKMQLSGQKNLATEASTKLHGDAIPLVETEHLESPFKASIPYVDRRKKREKEVYYETAELLAAAFPALVSASSERAIQSLDADFKGASEEKQIQVDTQRRADEDSKDHRNKVTCRQRHSLSRSEGEDAPERMLRLLHIYNKGHLLKCATLDSAEVADSSNPTLKERKHAESTADDALVGLISALLRATPKEDVQRKELKDWTEQVAAATTRDMLHRTGESDQQSFLQSPPPQSSFTSPSSAFPDVIPLEAINSSSLRRAGVWAKHQEMEKKDLLNEAIQSLATDARKNVDYLKEDLNDLHKGASSKIKGLKGLLKKSRTDNQGQKADTQSSTIADRATRKRVRIQDAAGRGDGARDGSRGETEEEARLRRVREMAKRLNE